MDPEESAIIKGSVVMILAFLTLTQWFYATIPIVDLLVIFAYLFALAAAIPSVWLYADGCFEWNRFTKTNAALVVLMWAVITGVFFKQVML